MEKKFLQVFSSFLPLAVVLTAAALLVFGASQQIIRQSAYDMPLISVETAQARIGLGQQLSAILPNIPVEMGKPYGFFFSAYDENEKVTIAQTTVNNVPVMPPSGVFEYAKAHGTNKLTWEPVTGVRSAIVMKYVPQTKTYLVAGRDLSDYEARITHLGMMVGVGWVVALAGTFITTIFLSLFVKKR